MVAKGVINSYNGKYGTIKKDNEIIDFEFKDISFSRKVNVGDTVEFRIEERFPNIKLARNINVIDGNINHKKDD